MSQSGTSSSSIFSALDQIDLMIQQAQFVPAMTSFIGLVAKLGGEYLWVEERRDWRHGKLDLEVGEICQRASAQWQTLLSSDIDLVKIPYRTLLPNLDILHSLLMGTYQGNLDSFTGALHRATQGQYRVPELLRLMLSWTPNSRIGWHPFGMYKVLPELVAAQAVATVCCMAPVGALAHVARNRAFDFLLSGQASTQSLSKYGVNQMVLNAWMRCSYADHPEKHGIKAFLGNVVAEMCGAPAAFNIDSGQPEAPASGKPVLLVPLEVMFSGHAMSRCYADLVSACRDQFHTVGVGIRGNVDESSAALFDEFQYIEPLGSSSARYKSAFKTVESLAQRVRPAIVWYPSVGMHAFTTALAQRRLAPVQAMTFGHPATSKSPAMDFAVLAKCHVEDVSLLSEQPLFVPSDIGVMRLPESAVSHQPELSAPVDGVIRVAVPSVCQKLSRPFIEALQTVQAACGRRVHFSFFTGVRGPLHSCAVHNIRKELADCTFHPMLDYPEYLNELSGCHLHAGTWPFGGTNSLVDSLRACLPVLAWNGPEPHSRIDPDFVRRAGLPDSFICNSQQEYSERLIELVNSPEELFEWRRFLFQKRDEIDSWSTEGQTEKFVQALTGLIGKEQGGQVGV